MSEPSIAIDRWPTKRLKFLGRIYAGLAGKSGPDFSKDYVEGFQPFIPFVSVANFDLIPDEYQFVRVQEAEQQNQVVPGDIVFLMSSETLEDVGKASLYLHEGKSPYLNSFCKGFRPNARRICARFLNFMLTSETVRAHFTKAGRGFTRINLKQSFVLDAPIGLPPINEQRAIADFLDDKCAKIDEAIRIKEEQIKLLQERRQILIQQAVTRGLNPDAPMKDSGIDWIGRIPVHWEIQRAKWLFQKMDREVRKQDGIVTCFRDGQVTLRAKRRTAGFTTALKEHGYQGVREGDLVIHAMDAFAGAIGVSDSDGKSSPVYSVCRPRISGLVEPKYYAYFLRSIALSGFLTSLAKGIRERSTDFRFKDFSELGLPLPKLGEQQEIVHYIAGEGTKIDDAISQRLAGISLLKEYKSTLINAAVTGKIKVC